MSCRKWEGGEVGEEKEHTCSRRMYKAAGLIIVPYMLR